MISRNKEDNDKEFLLSFFCGDDSLMIFLKNNIPLNIHGRKFLERSK